jgi:phasin family protein
MPRKLVRHYGKPVLRWRTLETALHNRYVASAKAVPLGRCWPGLVAGIFPRIETMAETADATAAFSEGYSKLTAMMGDAATHQKANYEALVASATAAGKGTEAVGTILAAAVKSASERAVGVTKSVFAAKSLQEVVELQAEYAKASVAAYIADLNAVTDVVTDAAKTSVKPISERATAMMAAVQAAA